MCMILSKSYYRIVYFLINVANEMFITGKKVVVMSMFYKFLIDGGGVYLLTV